MISQQLLGTEEVIVVGHSSCGMLTFRDDAVRREIATRTGIDIDLPLGAFDDLEDNVRSQVTRIRSHPWTKDAPVHGLAYEIESDRVREVARQSHSGERAR